MSTYQFGLRIDAPPDLVFDLWTDLDRMGEWIGGVTKVTDVSGPPGEAGTTYTTWFGNVSSRTEVLEAERPKIIRTRFGSWLLRGESKATFEPEGDGTRLTQEYRVQGLIPRVMARIFATGSYRGSFRGELNDFARLAARDARARKG
jgi:uncharacterized protein YndB with AHSA1/START domain